jgi:hypothetical protein
MVFPPAWYPDPTGAHDHRWWDGAEWTDHVADRGVAAMDPVTDAIARVGSRPSSSTTTASGAPMTGSAATDGRDRIGTAALIVGLLALPAALMPFLGVLVAGVALTLALIARRRALADERPVPGVTTGGLVTGSGALLLAVVVTWSALSFLTSGDNLRTVTTIMRDYLECVEERPVDQCRSDLERSLRALDEG